MSRTKRRVGQTKDYFWALSKLVRVSGRYQWMPIERGSKEYKKTIAVYHADATTTMGGSAPRSYCKTRWHKMRQEAKKQLHRFWRNEEHEVQIHANHKHSAKWDFW